MLLFDEVEQHDDVADDDTYQTDHAQEGHESERCPHRRERDQCADDAIRSCREHQERLHGVIELDEEREVDQEHRDSQNNHQVQKATLLFRLLAANLHRVTGRQARGKPIEFGQRGVQHFRR